MAILNHSETVHYYCSYNPSYEPVYMPSYDTGFIFYDEDEPAFIEEEFVDESLQLSSPTRFTYRKCRKKVL